MVKESTGDGFNELRHNTLHQLHRFPAKSSFIMELQRYKESLRMEDKVRLLCDMSYIKYLASCCQNPSYLRYSEVDRRNVHKKVMRFFGVTQIDLDSTKCVIEALKASVRPKCLDAGISLDQDHEVRCASWMMRVVACDHSRAKPPEDCIRDVLRFNEVSQYILASANEEFYMPLQKERTGLKVLTVPNEGQALFSFFLNASRKFTVGAVETEEMTMAKIAKNAAKRKAKKAARKKQIGK